MLYQDNSTHSKTQNQNLVVEELASAVYQSDSEVQQELDILENVISQGVSVPLTDLVVVDAGIILERIESIKHNLPTALAISIKILQQKQAIIQQAKNQAQQVLKSAQAEAERILQESTLLRQTELEASKIKFEAEQECEQLRQTTYGEIERWREMATIEYEEIQKDADNYARTVLSDLEANLTQMLTIVHNGRQQLEPNENKPEPLSN